MKLALSILALVIAALVVPFLIPGLGQRDGVDPNANLPWQIELDGQGGSRVFGIRPGTQTLGEARAVLGGEAPEVAIVAAPDEVGTLEAYYNEVALGFVLGKVVLTIDATPEMITAMRERAPKGEYMESTTRKIFLHPDDKLAADALPVRAISVIPKASLDEATLVQRFGAPGARVPFGDKRVHLLYPEKGLDVVVDAAGKELLQYVAPRDFERLREPLQKAAAGQ
ncbi:hypothetical protein [Azonexus sp.]|uniref:hypothetical protein n=1 Tax=Azonexus sp. TaxID=1872668 RepID=UPI0035AE4BBD